MAIADSLPRKLFLSKEDLVKSGIFESAEQIAYAKRHRHLPIFQTGRSKWVIARKDLIEWIETSIAKNPLSPSGHPRPPIPDPIPEPLPEPIPTPAEPAPEVTPTPMTFNEAFPEPKRPSPIVGEIQRLKNTINKFINELDKMSAELLLRTSPQGKYKHDQEGQYNAF